jgi:hypothetical protein
MKPSASKRDERRKESDKERVSPNSYRVTVADSSKDSTDCYNRSYELSKWLTEVSLSNEFYRAFIYDCNACVHARYLWYPDHYLH